MAGLVLWPGQQHLTLSELFNVCSRGPDHDPLLQLRCTAVLPEYVLDMLSLICGTGTLLMELWNSQAPRDSD